MLVLCALMACAGEAASEASPLITGVTPDSGPATGGTAVSIEGTGFEAGASVTFGGIAASGVDVTSSTSLTAICPPGTGTVDVHVSETDGTSGAVAHDWFGYEPPVDGLWLGLNGNSASNVYTGNWQGPVDEFSRDGIAYDRSFDIFAGKLPDETTADSQGGTLFEDRLKLDHEYGMIPVSPIEYTGYDGRLTPSPFFPQEERSTSEAAEGKTTIGQYVEGFIKTASAVLTIASQKYPGMPVLLEPMNEPWGYTTPWDNGAEYAKVLAKLLPAARAAGIPLTDIYVSAFGADQRLNKSGERESFAPGWVAAMYEAEPALKSEIQGWYFHPYGPPSGTKFFDSWGIQSVPVVRSEMTSGENNIIVSEVGYCASTEGGDCNESGEAEVATRSEAASRLTEMLENARPYYEAGWLKALIVYGRGDGGWAMVEEQSDNLSKQGVALKTFALAHAKAIPGEPGCSGADTLDGEPAAEAMMGAQLSGTVACPAVEARQESPPAPPPTASVTTSSAPPPGPPAPIEDPKPTTGGQVEVSHSLLLVRAGRAHVRLECRGPGRCVGRIKLAVAVHHGQSRGTLVAIGSASFSLRPGATEQTVLISITSSARRLLGRLRASHGRVSGLLSITESTPGTHALPSERTRLALD